MHAERCRRGRRFCSPGVRSVTEWRASLWRIDLTRSAVAMPPPVWDRSALTASTFPLMLICDGGVPSPPALSWSRLRFRPLPPLPAGSAGGQTDARLYLAPWRGRRVRLALILILSADHASGHGLGLCPPDSDLARSGWPETLHDARSIIGDAGRSVALPTLMAPLPVVLTDDVRQVAIGSRAPMWRALSLASIARRMPDARAAASHVRIRLSTTCARRWGDGFHGRQRCQRCARMVYSR